MSTLRLLTAPLSALLLAACSHTPPVRPLDAEGRLSTGLAVVHDSSRMAFWSLTELRAGSGVVRIQPLGASILPGEHHYQALVVRRNKTAILFLQDAFYLDALCGFTLDARPGDRFTLGEVDKSGRESTPGHPVYRATMPLAYSPAEGATETRTLAVECADTRLLKHHWFSFYDRYRALGAGFLCRSDADCPGQGNACRREPDFRHGVCLLPPAAAKPGGSPPPE